MKYFKSSEFDSPDLPGSGEKMNHKLLEDLDGLRHFVGKPFSINSGYRTSAHNNDVGGVPESAHTQGLAVDIKCSNSSFRYDILERAIAMGFNRIGIGKTFIHLDQDSSKPQEVVWLY